MEFVNRKIEFSIFNIPNLDGRFFKTVFLKCCNLLPSFLSPQNCVFPPTYPTLLYKDYSQR